MAAPAAPRRPQSDDRLDARTRHKAGLPSERFTSLLLAKSRSVASGLARCTLLCAEPGRPPQQSVPAADDKASGHREDVLAWPFTSAALQTGGASRGRRVMSDLINAEREVSRRKFLAMGGTIAAAGTVGPWIDPLSALAGTRWPNGHLTAPDAIRVKRSQFMPVGQFRAWNGELDRLGPSNQKGLRATGSPAHEGYIDELHHLLQRAGVTHVHFDPVPMTRWTTTHWSLDLLGGPSAGPVRTASYIPYSGHTPAHGVSAPLVYLDVANPPTPGSLAGKIAMFDVTPQVVPLSFFTGLAYPGATYDPHHEFSPTELYKRPYLSNATEGIEAAKAAGAAAMVGVIDYPFSAARGT